VELNLSLYLYSIMTNGNINIEYDTVAIILEVEKMLTMHLIDEE
jgi:hypothetical protein